MIGVMTLKGVLTVTETFGGTPPDGYIASLTQSAGATETFVWSTSTKPPLASVRTPHMIVLVSLQF